MFARDQRPPLISTRCRRLAAVAATVALSLAVMSSLHLSGALHGRRPPFSAEGAGIAEGVLCLALLWATSALVRRGPQARRVALEMTGLTIAGFAYGLSVTLRGGDTLDIAYHLTVLPILLAMFVTLLRSEGFRSERWQRSSS